MGKYNRTYHLPFSKGTTSDDRIAKDISNLIGTPIVITEKLDGSNTGFTNPGVYARSHAAFTQNPWDREMWNLHKFLKRDIEDDMFVFGENMYGIHSIEYSNLSTYFYLFGIRHNGRWYSWKEVEDFAFLTDLKTVPVLFKGTFNSEMELQQKVEELVAQPSQLGSDIREGIVIRVADSFNDSDFSMNIMKWVRKGHVQTTDHWTRNWTRAKLNWKWE